MSKREEEESSEINILVKNTAILASPKILIFILGLIKTKVIAYFLGTVGFGVVDQLSSTLTYIRQSTLSFLPDGMVKLLAKEKSEDFNKDEIGAIIKTYFYLLVPIILVVVGLTYIFADSITIFVFGDIKYRKYLLLGICALPISFVGLSIGALLKAFKEIKSIAIKDIAIFAINFLIFIPLVYYLKEWGAVISVVLSFLVSFAVSFFLVRKNVFYRYHIAFGKILKAKFSNKHFKELLAFVSVGIIGGTFRVFENMASRAIVVNDLGVDKIGLYAPISKWQTLFIGFILPAVYTYLYPRLSEAKGDKDIISVVNDVIRMITFLTLPFILVGISTREWIIPLFYSNEFGEASLYLPYHFSFLFFMVWGTILEQIFAPTGRLKALLVFLIVIYSLSLVMIYYLIPPYGLYGYLLKFTVTPFVALIVLFFYWKKEIGFSVRKVNVQLVSYAVFSAALMVLIKDTSIILQILIAVILTLLLVLFLSKNEKKTILKKLKIKK